MKLFKKAHNKSVQEFVDNHKVGLEKLSFENDKPLIERSTDFIAILKYRTTEEGGRSTSVKSGYRPTIKFPFSTMQTSGMQNFINKDYVMPGETIEAEIRILSVDFLKYQLYENLEFDFREGNRIIGTGKIIKVINPILISASR